MNGMEDIRKINQSVKRGGDIFIEFDVFNTPKSKQHFANKEMLIPKKDRIILRTTYLDVPPKWLGQKFIDDAEWLKENNPKAYEHEYLGIAVGEGATVFENLEIREITDDEIKKFDRIYNGVDWGWYPDPWAFNRMHFDMARRTLYIFDEDEANKKSNRQTADILIKKHGITSADLIICDSAEHKSTADYRSFGLFARDAEKGPGSVEYSMKWLASLFKIVIDPVRCPKATKEFTEYELEKDKEGNVITSYPDKNNHHIDDTRYALEPVWKVRGQ
jgi:phage terminase large subunit